MSICKHGLIGGRCPRCVAEVDAIVARGIVLRAADLRGLSAGQRSDLTLLLLARAARPR